MAACRSGPAGPLAVLFVFAGLLGCSEDQPPPADMPLDRRPDAPSCRRLFGDPSQPIEFEVGQFKDQTTFQPINDGDTLDLRFPPQGGQVAWVGIRATNIVGCGIGLRVTLIDKASNIQIERDERQSDLDPSSSKPGWGEPVMDISEYANIPLCPNNTAQEFVDVETVLEVVAFEKGTQRTVMKRLTVIPRCNEGGSVEADYHRALCQCQCRANYVAGRCRDIVDPLGDGGARGADGGDGGGAATDGSGATDGGADGGDGGGAATDGSAATDGGRAASDGGVVPRDRASG